MARQMTVLKSEADYEQALDEIERFFETEPPAGTPEADRFDELANAIAAYEKRHWSIEGNSPHTGGAQARDALARSTRHKAR